MAETINMPDLGLEDEGGELSVWLKNVGDSVQAGEPIAEIESEKVTLEVESPLTGVLLEMLIQPGEIATVGVPLAKVGAADELPDTAPQEPPAADLAEPDTNEENGAGAATLPQPAPSPAVDIQPVEPAFDGVFVTPIARRIAREHNLDLGRIEGSGPGGRILREDVENHLATSPAEAKAAAVLPQTGTVAAGTPSAPAHQPRQTVAPAASAVASPLRRTIAQRMSQSKQTVPHFYITTSVLMDDALTVRKHYNQDLPADQQITVNDIVMKATALALRDFPNLNASYVDDRIVSHPEINVGAAVAVEGGVLTVVSRQTDKRNIADIARDNRAMIQRARAGKVKRDDVSGSTFTISNLGAYDTDHFAAIINPPEAAILAVATARKTPFVVADRVEVRTVMQITISADHRVTDGAECALFLQKIKSLLEAPVKILLD